MFWTAATLSFEEAGRGAIVVDTTLAPIPGAGNPFSYFPQDQVSEQGNEDIGCLVADYDPTQEFVVVLLNSGNHTSAYRVRRHSPELHARTAREAESHDPAHLATELRIKPPDMETLIAWDAEGRCEAACPHRCWVEPDGTCPHGNPSWLLQLGLI